MKARIQAPLWAMFLLACSVVVYWPGLSGGFIFDDISTIVQNQRVHAETLDAQSLSRAAWSFEPGGTLGARPLSMASFGVNHAMGGLDPWDFKVTGLLVHMLNALLVFALVRRILAHLASGGGNWALPASAVIALLWAIHPLQVSTVLYVVQRMETLSYTFVLLGLWLYLHGRLRQQEGLRAWPWLTACIPAVGLGMAAKESAALFPAFTFALELTLLNFAARRPGAQRAWRWAYCVGIGAALLVFALIVVPHFWADAHAFRNFGTAERLLTQLRVLPLYLGQIVLPLPGSMPFYYDNFLVSQGLFDPLTTLFGGLLILLLAAAAFTLRKRMPLFALGLLWFFAAHALTSNVVPLELVFEHRNYFALLGVLLAAADLVRRIPAPDGPILKQLAIGLVVLGFGFLAFLRASTWGEPFLLASDLTDKNPGSSRASSDLAAIYLEMTDNYPNSPFYDFAMREFERGSLIADSSIISDQGLILTATQAGRPVKDEWWQRLIDKVRYGSIPPDTSQALFGLLGNRYKGFELDDDRLVDAFLAFFERATLPAHSYAQFGDYVLTYVGDKDLADQMFALAVRRSQTDPEYVQQIIRTLETQGHFRQAEVARQAAQQTEMNVSGSHTRTLESGTSVVE